MTELESFSIEENGVTVSYRGYMSEEKQYGVEVDWERVVFSLEKARVVYRLLGEVLGKTENILEEVLEELNAEESRYLMEEE